MKLTESTWRHAARAMYPFVAICFGMAAMGGAAPALPCKSAQELLKAVEYALTNQDTNYFWKLCYWKDVPAADEPMYKRIWLIHFKQPSDATKEYSGFRLQPLPKDYDVNKPKPRRRGGNEFVGPNLPIIGFIGYKTKGTLADVDIRGRSARYSAGGDIEYSKAPDGTYWLPVNVPVPVGPNKSSSTP